MKKRGWVGGIECFCKIPWVFLKICLSFFKAWVFFPWVFFSGGQKKSLAYRPRILAEGSSEKPCRLGPTADDLGCCTSRQWSCTFLTTGGSLPSPSPPPPCRSWTAHPHPLCLVCSHRWRQCLQRPVPRESWLGIFVWPKSFEVTCFVDRKSAEQMSLGFGSD